MKISRVSFETWGLQVPSQRRVSRERGEIDYAHEITYRTMRRKKAHKYGCPCMLKFSMHSPADLSTSLLLFSPTTQTVSITWPWSLWNCCTTKSETPKVWVYWFDLWSTPSVGSYTLTKVRIRAEIIRKLCPSWYLKSVICSAKIATKRLKTIPRQLVLLNTYPT